MRPAAASPACHSNGAGRRLGLGLHATSAALLSSLSSVQVIHDNAAAAVRLGLTKCSLHQRALLLLCTASHAVIDKMALKSSDIIRWR